MSSTKVGTALLSIKVGTCYLELCKILAKIRCCLFTWDKFYRIQSIYLRVKYHNMSSNPTGPTGCWDHNSCRNAQSYSI